LHHMWHKEIREKGSDFMRPSLFVPTLG